MTRILAVVVLLVLCLTPAAPSSASCAADAGPARSAVIFTGRAVEERRGFTRMEVDEVWAGPDLAPDVWVLSGQRQPRWPLYLLSAVGSSVDATFEPGVEYAVGATSAFTTGACSVIEASAAGDLRPEDPREPVARGLQGADPPAGPWLTGTGFVLLAGLPVAVLVVLRRRRERSADR